MGIEEINIEADGYITKDTDCSWGKPLERVSDNTANPTTECCYPRCEMCAKYGAYGDSRFCTVPMVITKQMFLIAEEKMQRLECRLSGLESLVEDNILGNEQP